MQRRRLILGAILAAAFALRLGHWLAVRHEPFVAQLIVDSQEYDRWAQEIASGQWIGTRVFEQAPLYPYVLAAAYKVAGHTVAVVYLLQIVASIFGLWALARAGRAIGQEDAGLIAAGLGALYGPFLFYDVLVLKESLAVTTVCFLLWALAAAAASGRPSRWLVAGGVLGVLVLLRENALLTVPFLALLAVRRPFRLAPAGAFVLGAILPLVPVAARNAYVGGDLLPTSASGGMNFYIGNNATADGTFRPVVPGKQIPALEQQESRRVAEVAVGHALTPGEVSSWWMKRSLTWASAHPGAFVLLQLRKVGLYWAWPELPDTFDYAWMRTRSFVLGLPLLQFGTVSLLAIAGFGLILHRRTLGTWAPAWALAGAWMLSTVVFFLLSRYRLPGIPPLLLLAALPLATLFEGRALRTRAWWSGAVAAGLAIAVSLVPASKARADLVEYNLGRLAQEKGDVAEAEKRFAAALDANPDMFLASMNLGTIAAGRHDFVRARAFFERAAASEPASDDVQCNLGGVYLALGDLPSAEAHLNRALELNPRNLLALQNETVLLTRRGDLTGATAMNARLLALDPENGAGLRMRDRIAEASKGLGS
ncbi:MAG TPA: tetratricopeptide repeat protein [Candidatus Polarisedimenticolaceae bacterium]|nr:tetratricopeptide repeat protein [Candidatus Polarisedimenticolaceae bacterium]